MRSRLLLLIGVATVPATVSVTTAAALQPSSFAPSSVSVAPIRRAGAPDSSRINAILSRADAATFSGRANEARRLYRDLIDQQLGQYADRGHGRQAGNGVDYSLDVGAPPGLPYNPRLRLNYGPSPRTTQ